MSTMMRSAKTRVLLHRSLGSDGDADMQGAWGRRDRRGREYETTDLPGPRSLPLAAPARSPHQPVRRWRSIPAGQMPAACPTPRCARPRKRHSPAPGPCLMLLGRTKWIGIDAFHHGVSFSGHRLKHGNRPQRSAEPLHEPEEDGDAHQIADDRQRDHHLRRPVVDSARGGNGVGEGKYERARHPFEPPVLEHRGDDPRGQLRWQVAR